MTVCHQALPDDIINKENTVRTALCVIGLLSICMSVLTFCGLLLVGQVVADLEESGVSNEPNTLDSASWVGIGIQVACALTLLVAAAQYDFRTHRVRLCAAALLLVAVTVWSSLAFSVTSTLADAVQQYVVTGAICCAVATFVGWACFTAARHR